MELVERASWKALSSEGHEVSRKRHRPGMEEDGIKSDIAEDELARCWWREGQGPQVPDKEMWIWFYRHRYHEAPKSFPRPVDSLRSAAPILLTILLLSLPTLLPFVHSAPSILIVRDCSQNAQGSLVRTGCLLYLEKLFPIYLHSALLFSRLGLWSNNTLSETFLWLLLTLKVKQPGCLGCSLGRTQLLVSVQVVILPSQY